MIISDYHDQPKQKVEAIQVTSPKSQPTHCFYYNATKLMNDNINDNYDFPYLIYDLFGKVSMKLLLQK